MKERFGRLRDRIGLPRIEALLYDLRHAIRSLSRRKILVLTTTISIAFGVGVNIAAYTLLRGLLFNGWVAGVPAGDENLAPVVGWKQTLKPCSRYIQLGISRIRVEKTAMVDCDPLA